MKPLWQIFKGGENFAINGQNGNSFGMYANSTQTASAVRTGSLMASDSIDRFRFFNANAGSGSSNDAYFNSITIVPEPGATAGLAAAALATPAS